MIKKDKLFQVIANIIMIALSLACIIPFLLLIVSSITEEVSLVQNGYSFIPKKISFLAYKYIFMGSNQIVRAYIISILVTIIGTVANVALTTLFAYPLSRKDLPGRNIFSFILFFTMLFNGGLIPSYIMWTQVFHIKNTYLALLIPNLLMNAFYIIMMRTYFTTNIPDAVIEAARIDGAGEFKILYKIVLPISVPILATVGMLVGLSYWNNWTNGLYYINKDAMYSLPVLLNRMLLDVQYLMNNAQTGSSISQDIKLPATGIKMAVAVVGALPILIVYPLFQKYFVKGITIGAVKG